MAKQTIQYEVSDIDIKDNEVHAALFAAILVGALTMTRRADSAEEKEELSKTAVAAALSIVENLGFVLAKREEVPPVFASLFNR